MSDISSNQISPADQVLLANYQTALNYLDNATLSNGNSMTPDARTWAKALLKNNFNRLYPELATVQEEPTP